MQGSSRMHNHSTNEANNGPLQESFELAPGERGQSADWTKKSGEVRRKRGRGEGKKWR